MMRTVETPGIREPFLLELGFRVPPETSPTGDVQVKRLAPFPCMPLLYSGGGQHVEGAYTRLINAIEQAGLKPTGEGREEYFYFDGPESPDNITYIAFGIQEPL